MSMVEVKVPDIGDFKEVEIIELLVKIGDTIKVDQSLITVESDKASMEIPSTQAGIVKELKVKIGDKVAEGSVLLMVEAEAKEEADAAPAEATASVAVDATSEVAPPAKEGASAASATAPASTNTTNATAPEAATPAASTATAAASPALTLVESSSETEAKTAGAKAPAAAPGGYGGGGDGRPVAPAASGSNVVPHASPSIRKFSRELGIDLIRVTGTGPKGRITQQDVQNYVKKIVSDNDSAAVPDKADVKTGTGIGLDLLAWPSLDFTKFGTTELLPLSRIKKISGPNLHRNWVMIPHVTQFDEADVTELEEFRKSSNTAMAKSGVKLTMLAFVIKGCVVALKKFPAFNASLDAKGENLILKQFYNIGFAADTPNGLVVPVIKNADQKGVAQIAQEMADMSALAREGKLKPADMQGASFTISSLGGIGGTAFTPIINAPEVAILGLSKAAMKPLWDGKAFQPRLMMPLSLSYDHRVIDGAMGARFSVYLSELLGDMRKILL